MNSTMARWMDAHPGEKLYVMSEHTFRETLSFWFVFGTVQGVFVGSALTVLAHIVGWWQ